MSLSKEAIESMTVLVKVIKNLNKAFPECEKEADDKFIVRYVVNKMTFDVSEEDQKKIVNNMRTENEKPCPKKQLMLF